MSPELRRQEESGRRNYETSGPGGQQTNQNFTGAYDMRSTYGSQHARRRGRRLEEFEVTTTSGQLVSVLYIAGSGSAGATGNKTGFISVNFGSYSDGSADMNPRLSIFGR